MFTVHIAVALASTCTESLVRCQLYTLDGHLLLPSKCVSLYCNVLFLEDGDKPTVSANWLGLRWFAKTSRDRLDQLLLHSVTFFSIMCCAHNLYDFVVIYNFSCLVTHAYD